VRREQEEIMAHIIDREELPHSDMAYRFEGNLYGNADVSFFLIDSDRGGGPELHTHPYAEVFVIQDGEVTFTAGDETIEAKAGQIVVVPAGLPHKYVNSGAGRSRHIDIHTSGRMITTWLEE
jgi:mannose-6-phosphate isomerase-like protein (cupin superfamily)